MGFISILDADPDQDFFRKAFLALGLEGPLALGVDTLSLRNISGIVEAFGVFAYLLGDFLASFVLLVVVFCPLVDFAGEMLLPGGESGMESVIWILNSLVENDGEIPLLRGDSSTASGFQTAIEGIGTVVTLLIDGLVVVTVEPMILEFVLLCDGLVVLVAPTIGVFFFLYIGLVFVLVEPLSYLNTSTARSISEFFCTAFWTYGEWYKTKAFDQLKNIFATSLAF